MDEKVCAYPKTKNKTFEGKLQKIRIITNTVCFGPMPDSDDEVEQHLSIHENGSVWLTRYRFGAIDDRSRFIKKEKIPTDAETAIEILDAIGQHFIYSDICFVTDVGYWQMDMTNTEGKIFSLGGPVGLSETVELSKFVRDKLGRQDLLLFDGNPDSIERIEVIYDQHLEDDMPDPSDPDDSVIIDDTHEELLLDRQSEMIEIHRKFSYDCDIHKIYHLEEKVSGFLDKLDPNIFSHVVGNPEDVYEDPHDTSTYRITVTTRLKGRREISGSFDKYGLPEDWPGFAEMLQGLITYFGDVDLFKKNIYNRPRRRTGDLIFCYVAFAPGGRVYCYQADEEYPMGTRVIVPVGEDNQETEAVVKVTEFRQADRAPYPLDRIKHVIRRAERGDLKCN